MAAIELGIPSDKWSERIKPLLRDVLTEVRRLRESSFEEEFERPVDLYNITMPWLVADELKNEETERMTVALLRNEALGMEFANELVEILKEDDHLNRCLVRPMLLAKTLDKFLYPNSLGDDYRIDDSTFDFYADGFLEHLYEQPYRAFTFSHIFNFQSDLEALEFGESTIRKIPIFEIPFLLNEATSQSYLHPYASGEFFVVHQTDEILDNDLNWVAECHISADSLIRIFQYFKDGVVHVNYSTIYFKPFWLNGIRKHGSLFLGNYRSIAYSEGSKFFEIDSREYVELRNWWRLSQLPDVAEKLGVNRNNFGKVLEFAGMYFESSLTQVEFERRLIDLTISLESIFSPGKQSEISFQLSQSAAEFVGNSPQEKKEIFGCIKKMYDKRSKLLHGNPKADVAGFIALDDLEKFSSIIRRALLKLVALYLNGEKTHKEFIERLRFGLFDPAIQAKLQKDGNLSEIIDQRLRITNDAPN